jgi:hypothetical protein
MEENQMERNDHAFQPLVRAALLAGVISTCGLPSDSAQAAAGNIQPIALSGETLPGLSGNAIDSQNWTFDVNAAGRVVFIAITDATDSGGAARDGVFAFTPGDAPPPTLIQADDEPASGTGATYSGFTFARSAGNGQTLFGGLLKLEGSVVTGFNNEFLAIEDGEGTNILAREGAPADGGNLFPSPSGDIYFSENVTLNRLYQTVTMDANANVAFQPGSNTSAFNAGDDSPYLPGVAHVWTVSNQGDTGLAFHRQATALPGGLRLRAFTNTRFVQNDAGQLAFGAVIEGADGSSLPGTSDSALYVRDANGIFVEKLRETGAPTFDRVNNLQSAFVKIDDAGELFFYSQRDSFNDGFGVYTTAVDDGFDRIARLGALFVYNLSGGGSEVVAATDFPRGGLGFDVGAAGTAAVIVEVQQNDFPSAVRESLLVYENGQAFERFKPGNLVIGLEPGDTVELGTASSLRAIEMNRNGWIAFSADVLLDSGFRETALFVSSSEGETFVIAVEDQLFDFDGQGNRILTQIQDWRLDDTNTVTMSGRFLDGSSGLFSVTVGRDSLFRDRFEN